MQWAQVATIVSTLAAIIGLQTFWISRALDRVYVALDRVDERLDRLEAVVLREHAERIARLEARFD